MRSLLYAFAFVLAVLVAPASAVAGVLTKSGSQVTYFAASGEANSVSLIGPLVVDLFVYVKDDGAAINGLSPCTSAAAGAWARCPSGAVDVVLGDQNDTLTVATDRPILSLRVWGGDGGDVLTGVGADETFHGEAGADTLNGAGGDDVLDGGTEADMLDGGEGLDEADYSTRTDDLTITLDGVANDGWRYFTPPPKQLVTEGDNVDTEVVRTGSGSDLVIGDALSNRLFVGEGTNVAAGGDGGDWLTSGGGADSLFGDSGADQLEGGGGSDTLAGGDNADSLYGGDGMDTLNGETGDDSLSGGPSADTLNGDSGNDRLSGGPDADTLNGGDGYDSLDGGPGGPGDADVMNGGADPDTADYSLRAAAIAVDLVVEPGQGDGVEGDTITGVENARGGSGGDTLRGDDSANVLKGYAGDDLVEGRGGDDVLDGLVFVGAGGSCYPPWPDPCTYTDEFDYDGRDTLRGGSGNDRLAGGEGDDTLEGGPDDDQLYGMGLPNAFSHANSYSNVMLVSDADNLDGGDGDDQIDDDFGPRLIAEIGADATWFDDVLTGGAGSDSLFGLAGDDRFEVRDGEIDNSLCGDGADTVVADAGDFASGDCETVERPPPPAPPPPPPVGGGSTLPSGCDIAGTQGNDVITGTSKGERICGLGGNDVIKGLGGNDVLIGGKGNDRLVGGKGKDRFLGGAGKDFLAMKDGAKEFGDGGAGIDTASTNRGDKLKRVEKRR